VNTARKPRDRRVETRKRQREASIRSWAVYSLFALLCTTFGAEGEDRSTQPTAPPLASRSVPQVRVDSRTSRLTLIDGLDIQFRRLPVTEGLSQTRVSTIVQDNLGFLWFATQYGLNRYDGYRFKVFKHEPGRANSLSSVYIRSLFKDRSGILWVGCEQSLDRFNPVTESFTHYRIVDPETNENAGNLNYIGEDRDGKLWLGTDHGLFKLDPATGQTIRYVHDPNDPFSLSSDSVTFTGEDSQGTFWVANGGDLDAFDRETGKISLHVPLGGPVNAFLFHEDKFGVFWIARASPYCPLAVMDRKTRRLRCFSIYEGKRPITTLAGIFSMLESRDGTMWLATEGAGLLKFDREHNRLIRYRNHPEDGESLGSDHVISLFEDREGDIWTSLHQTAPNFFSEGPPSFENFTHQRGNLGGSLVTTIYEDRNRILWIGSTGALNRIDRANGRNTAPPGVGVKGEILSILEDRSGVLVAGTYRQGLQRLDPTTGHAEPYQPSQGDISNQDKNPIQRILIDHLGTLWAATLGGGLSRFNPKTGNFTTYRPDARNRVDYSDIKEDPNGGLWLGGESGLQLFDQKTGRFTKYKHDPENPHTVSDNRVNSVFLDRAGGMWLGTQDGLDKFDPKSGTFEVYYEKDGLSGNVVSCILEDERGDLWMGTNSGLSSFNPQTKKFKNFSAADGLPGPDLTGWSTCFRSPRGEMFFGGFSGATAFYPGRIRDSSYLPNTVLTDFRLSGVPVAIGSSSPLNRSITYTDSITLSRRQNNFAIEFSALSYFNAATNHYRYKLEGLDNQWHEVGSDQRLASYTTLPWGRYTFRVQGATSRGAWSEPGAALSIEILPPWWGTWWFRVSCVGGFVLLLWALYQLRLQQLQRQFNMTLDARVGERTRIARELHDTLLQSLHGLMCRFQAARNMLPGRPEQAMQTLDGAIARTERAIAESRDAIGDLRSGPVAQSDLAELLTAMGQELAAFEDANGNGPLFRVIVEGERRRLSPILQEEVYSIARELLRNAFQHAHAHRIEAEIRYEDHLFRMRVRDDGKGMDPKVLEFGGRAGHWGLPGLRERAQKLGVRLDFWSEAGAGTEVQLTVPAAVAYEKSHDRAGFRLFRKARIHEHQS
jgi:signal transduction histidine kinase/ligand-binding sensor domain-containing protein